jgi:sRNA-binding carbon storage regulator CsrA
MLVLKRKRREKIVVRTKSGDEIVIVVAECTAQHASIGIQADRDVEIWREELDPGLASKASKRL